MQQRQQHLIAAIPHSTQRLAFHQGLYHHTDYIKKLFNGDSLEYMWSALSGKTGTI